MINNILQLIKKEKEEKREGLEKYFSLSEKVKVYVPSTKNVDEPMSNEEHEKYVQYVMDFMIDLFEGASRETIVGGYKSKEKGKVYEKITIVYSFVGPDGLTKEKEEAVEKLAKWLQVELGQESVMVEVERIAKAYFIE